MTYIVTATNRHQQFQAHNCVTEVKSVGQSRISVHVQLSRWQLTKLTDNYADKGLFFLRVFFCAQAICKSLLQG